MIPYKRPLLVVFLSICYNNLTNTKGLCWIFLAFEFINTGAWYTVNENIYCPFAVMADWGWVTYTVLEVLIAVACCLGNVLVVCAVAVGIQDCLREPTFCFLVSLAVADFLVGAAAVPLAVLLDGWVSLTSYQCLFLSCVVLVLTEASVLSLLAIATDRYLRLHMPFRLRQPLLQGIMKLKG